MTHLLRPGRLEVETDLLLGAEEVLLPSSWRRESAAERNEAEREAKALNGGGVPQHRSDSSARMAAQTSANRGFDAALFESKPTVRRPFDDGSIAQQTPPSTQSSKGERPSLPTSSTHTSSQTSNHGFTPASPSGSAGNQGNLPPRTASSIGERGAIFGDSIVPPAGTSNAERLELLRIAHAASCPHCTTVTGYTNLVFGEGNADAELVFVGEAPGESEDLAGRPFVGKAGEKLDEMIRAMGLAREDVYIANVLKARPPENRTPLAHEMERCGPYLLAQLSILRPKAIVTLGGPATKLILQSELGITRLRGVMHEVTLGVASGHPFTVPVMPTFHPAYLLRNYTVEVRKQMWEDLKQVLSVLGRNPPSRS
ncbi:MAG: hypothetical protein RL591_841 [Planctomycetota bacterium]